MLAGCGEKGTLIHWWWECKFIQSLWKTVGRLFKKLKVELPYYPPMLLLEVPEGMKVRVQQRHLHTHVYYRLFTIAKKYSQSNTICMKHHFIEETTR
jgi:hypothetical protein